MNIMTCSQDVLGGSLTVGGQSKCFMASPVFSGAEPIIIIHITFSELYKKNTCSALGLFCTDLAAINQFYEGIAIITVLSQAKSEDTHLTVLSAY